MKFEGGGSKNPYSAMNLDAEYRGYFDRPKRDAERNKLRPVDRAKQPNFRPHRASKYHPSKGYHVGLSYGAWQAAQEPGALGKLLLYMYSDDPELFTEIFLYPDELLQVTRAKGKREGRRSPRTQKVKDYDLWTHPWISRFREAAEHEVFRKSQRRWVSDNYLDPAIEVAKSVGFKSAADLAVAFDIAIQFGPGYLRKRAKRIPKGDWSPEKLGALIDILPSARRDRRRKIEARAGHEVFYDLS